MVAIINPYGLAAKRQNTLGPEPGVIGRIGEMTRQLFLNVLVLRKVDETQDQVCPA